MWCWWLWCVTLQVVLVTVVCYITCAVGDCGVSYYTFCLSDTAVFTFAVVGNPLLSGRGGATSKIPDLSPQSKIFCTRFFDMAQLFPHVTEMLFAKSQEKYLEHVRVSRPLNIGYWNLRLIYSSVVSVYWRQFYTRSHSPELKSSVKGDVRIWLWILLFVAMFLCTWHQYTRLHTREDNRRLKNKFNFNTCLVYVSC
jgi:hypothetical protein